MLNILTDRWLPVTRRSGATDTIRPSDLTDQYADDPITALAFSRADFNGAVTEFLIGLHAVAMPVKDVHHWHARWREPPTAEAVADAMALLAFAFELMGAGARCFQDLDPLEGAKASPVQQLLIDAPGDNMAKLNQDLFTRRRGADHRLSWPDAAAALITLQTYAPSGGAGHRTSMRGGGPLTTLVRPRRDGQDDRPVPLWDVIHANAPRGHEVPPPDGRLFPWLADTLTSAGKAVVTEEDAHPLQAFFPTPRRLRLMGDEDGCAGFRTVPRGANYEGWRHPLSPYYEAKGAWLPVHPREGTPTFRDWPGVWGEGEGRAAAACVRAFGDVQDKEWIAADLHAFGFDMDNAKARAWQETTPPLVLDERRRAWASDMVAAAGDASGALRLAVKRVLYGQAREKDGKIDLYLPDTVPKRACAEVAAALERGLEDRLAALIAFLRCKATQDRDAAFLAWHRELRGEALRLFDRAVTIEAVSADDLLLVVRSRMLLTGAFGPKGSVAKALGLSKAALGKAAEERRAA